MKTALILVSAIIVAFYFAAPAAAQDDEADRKTIKKILEEIELVPSLYAKGETALNAKTAPKFSSIKLVSYPMGKVNAPEVEREAWLKNKENFTRDKPVRAAVFEAAAETDSFKNLSITRTLTKTQLTPKEKAAFLKKQAPLGVAIFKLEQVLEQMRAADKQREKETVRRWKLDFDFAQTRMLGNLIYLYEYNYVLGAIRADSLPDPGNDGIGWKVVTRPKITVTEQKAKAYVKDRAKLLEQIQKDHAATPWAYFAERDARRELGMAWEPRKK
jgi:hypothetical protein